MVMKGCLSISLLAQYELSNSSLALYPGWPEYEANSFLGFWSLVANRGGGGGGENGGYGGYESTCHTASVIPRLGSTQEESGNEATHCSLLDSSIAIKHDSVVRFSHEVDENTTGAVDHLPASRVQKCHHHLINWERRERGRWSCTQSQALWY